MALSAADAGVKSGDQEGPSRRHDAAIHDGLREREGEPRAVQEGRGRRGACRRRQEEGGGVCSRLTALALGAMLLNVNTKCN